MKILSKILEVKISGLKEKFQHKINFLSVEINTEFNLQENFSLMEKNISN